MERCSRAHGCYSDYLASKVDLPTQSYGAGPYSPLISFDGYTHLSKTRERDKQCLEV